MVSYVHPPAPYSGLQSFGSRSSGGLTQRAQPAGGVNAIDAFSAALGAKLYKSVYDHYKYRNQETGGKYLSYDMSFQKRQKMSGRFKRVGRNTRRRRLIRRSRAVTLWPRQKLVKMVMSFGGQFTSGTGTINVTVVKANSLNDPTGSLTAQLPLGMDQWATMYQKYVVVGSKAYVRAHNQTSTGSMLYGISLKNTNVSLTNWQYYCETPLTVSKMLTADVDHSGLGSSYNAKRFWKVRKFMDAEDQQATLDPASPTDPTDLAYYHLWAQDVNQTEAVTYEFVVNIEYYVLVFDPIIPSRSSL